MHEEKTQEPKRSCSQEQISAKQKNNQTIYRGYRYELKPNNRQRTLLAKHAGCARFAYNWGLERRIKRFQSEKGKERFTTAFKQYHQLVRLKRTDFPWLYEVSKWAPQEALRDLDKAFANFFRGLKTGRKVGFPKFKKKGIQDSFRLYAIIRVFKKSVQLPRLGRIHLKEEPQIQGRILFATVKRKADRWFVSFNVEQEKLTTSNVSGSKIGVDLGLKTLVTLSNGTKIENPQALTRRLHKLKRLSKQVSRKKRGSKNRWKALIRLSRIYLRISNIRRDTLHKVTTFLAKNHSQIVIEDLYVKGLIRNKRLSLEITDASMSEFRRQLEYKTRWYGSELIVAPRFYPSSKRCSRCGEIKDNLSLAARTFICKSCGLRIDRDINAANNLVAASWVETKNACLEVGGYRSVRPVPTNEAGTEHYQDSLDG